MATLRNTTDNAYFTSEALFNRASRHQYATTYNLPFRPHQPAPRVVSAATTVKEDNEAKFADLAHELRLRHYERTRCMPRHERGRYWTWAMFPGARLGLPPQKDIDNAKEVFEASLRSEVEALEAAEYFSKDGPAVMVQDMRTHIELFLEVYMAMRHEGDEKAKSKLSTQFLRNHASRVFTALARASNFVTMDVVIGTYEWIDEYLSVKFDLRTNKDDNLEMSLPVLEIAESIRTRSSNGSHEEVEWYDNLCEPDGHDYLSPISPSSSTFERSLR